MSPASHARASRTPDPTVYPESEKVGESSLHNRILELLRPLVEKWLAERGVKAFAGSEQFIYWVQYEPTVSVCPDIYVLPGIAQGESVRAWKVWERGGVVPNFAMEVVSRDWRKDYELGPPKYAKLGVDELIIFDPLARPASRERIRWQVLRLDREGRWPSYTLVERTNADRVRSSELGCWLRAVGEGEELRVRLALDPNGDDLFATALEDAEAEVARLRAEIDRLRGG